MLKKIEKLKREFEAKDFSTIRGKVAYVATCTRPDISFMSAKLAQLPSEKAGKFDRKLLNSAIKMLTEEIGLVFSHIDPKTVRIVGYADGILAGNDDLTCQLGMTVLLEDGNDSATAIPYGSWESRRVTRTILVAEVIAFSVCTDYCVSLKRDLETAHPKKIEVDLYTDSKSLFDTIIRLTTVSEKRFLIDISSIRETYKEGDVCNVAHVDSEYNLADSFTKKKRCPLLERLMVTGYLKHPINQWIINH